MTARERWFRAVVRAYPWRYRAERGDEVLTTLLESSETASWVSMAADGLDVVGHGLRLRLGMTPDRFGGRVLDLAALPGLMMAAAFAVFLFVWGEWLPVKDPLFPGYDVTRFGPFLTIGPAIYLAWVLGAAGSVLYPRWQRGMAALCITVTAVAFVVGKVWFGAPNFFQMVVLVALGVPALLAPATDTAPRRVPASLAAGVTTFVAAWWFGALHPTEAGRYLTIYWAGNSLMGHGLPWAAGATLLAVVTLLAVRRVDLAGAVVVLTVPLLVVAAGYVRSVSLPYGRPAALIIVGALALVAPLLWLATAWSLDVRRPRLDEPDPA